MGKLKSLFVKVLTLIVIAGTIPSLSGLHVAKAEGPSDPAPFIGPIGPANGKQVLFDNTHGQTAGAADWVIDGGFSDFANAIAGKGYSVKELRKSSPITYEDLKNYNVFVIGEANIPYKKSEQDAMLQYVQNGGSIFFIADHYNADRNKNRWDASEVFNGYRRGAYDNPAKGMTTDEANSAAMQGVQSSDWLSDNFGIRFRYNAVGDLNTSNLVSPSESFGITSGVGSVAVHAGSTLAITNPHQAKGIVFLPTLTSKDAWPNAVDQGVYFGGGVNEGPFAAISKLGKGKAAFIGDSSPVEDSTPKYLKEENGQKKTTYDGFKEVNDGIFLTNMIDWLAKQEDYSSFDNTGITLDQVSPMLNSEIPKNSTEPQAEPWSAPAAGYKWYDPSTFAPGSYGSTKSAPVNPAYSFVHQATLPNAEEFQIRVNLDNLSPGQTVSSLQMGIYLNGGTQVGQIQNADGTWPSGYGYSSNFSVTANSSGHASKDLTVRIKSGTTGAANLRLRMNGNNLITESVTIGNVHAEPLPEDKPNLPEKISLADARKAASGTVVTVEGIVISTPGVFGGKGFYLQDDTAGIYVFLNDGDFKPGDKVKITAPLSVYNTELELSDPLAIEKTGTGDIPNPVTVSELNDNNQGMLVKLENVQIQNLTSLNRAFEFDAVKDGKTTRVRVDERTGLTYDQFTSQYKNGDVVNMSGVSSIFKGTYQLKPLSLNDFELADKTPPVIHDLDTLSFYLTDKIVENINVTDEGTGVKSVKITLDGVEVQNPIEIEPLQLALGQHIISVTAVDNAGNVSTRDFVIQVIMDTDHLGELLAIGYDNGKITNHGIYNSLQVKVKNIQNAKSEKVRQNMIHAFVNEVNAQKGKKIDADFAELLISTSVVNVQYEEAI